MLTYTCSNCGNEYKARISTPNATIEYFYKGAWIPAYMADPCPSCSDIGQKAKEKAIKEIKKKKYEK